MRYTFNSFSIWSFEYSTEYKSKGVHSCLRMVARSVARGAFVRILYALDVLEIGRCMYVITCNERDVEVGNKFADRGSLDLLGGSITTEAICCKLCTGW